MVTEKLKNLFLLSALLWIAHGVEEHQAQATQAE
jgi:hypothetical protein